MMKSWNNRLITRNSNSVNLKFEHPVLYEDLVVAESLTHPFGFGGSWICALQMERNKTDSMNNEQNLWSEFHRSRIER